MNVIEVLYEFQLKIPDDVYHTHILSLFYYTFGIKIWCSHAENTSLHNWGCVENFYFSIST